jgi:hypothetical protein
MKTWGRRLGIIVGILLAAEVVDTGVMIFGGVVLGLTTENARVAGTVAFWVALVLSIMEVRRRAWW